MSPPSTYIQITARFNGQCKVCRNMLHAGDRVAWEKDKKGITCLTCAKLVAKPTPTPPPPPAPAPTIPSSKKATGPVSAGPVKIDAEQDDDYTVLGTNASSTVSGLTYEIRKSLNANQVYCTCPGYMNGGKCWHMRKHLQTYIKDVPTRIQSAVSNLNPTPQTPPVVHWYCPHCARDVTHKLLDGRYYCPSCTLKVIPRRTKPSSQQPVTPPPQSAPITPQYCARCDTDITLNHCRKPGTLFCHMCLTDVTTTTMPPHAVRGSAGPPPAQPSTSRLYCPDCGTDITFEAVTNLRVYCSTCDIHVWPTSVRPSIKPPSPPPPKPSSFHWIDQKKLDAFKKAAAAAAARVASMPSTGPSPSPPPPSILRCPSCNSIHVDRDPNTNLGSCRTCGDVFVLLSTQTGPTPPPPPAPVKMPKSWFDVLVALEDLLGDLAAKGASKEMQKATERYTKLKAMALDPANAAEGTVALGRAIIKIVEISFDFKRSDTE